MEELRRVIGGTFLAISCFYPEDDAINRAALEKLGLDVFTYRRSALQNFETAGWQVTVENICKSGVKPTPVGEVLVGATVDTLPVVETELEWCVLDAHRA
ncbi:MAG: hypothetical protein JXA42_19640 [Anaerolineales bacterium]|nr:hypothetical protein [Anaerolineales bacterium]